MYGNNIHLGKTFDGGGKLLCNIGVDGAEIHVEAFEILFAK